MNTDRRLMLDTHIWIWYLLARPELPMHEVVTIENHPRVCVSFASLLEMTIKSSLGKIDLLLSISDWADLSRRKAVAVLHPDVAALERLAVLPRQHKDPFDRIIISQALSLGAILHTHDQLIRQYDLPVYPL